MLIFVLASVSTQAQRKSKRDKKEKLKGADYITISIDTESGDMSEVPASSKKLLASKLRQTINKGGITSEASGSRFYISTDISVLDQNRTPTAPPMVALSLELYITMGDSQSGDQYATQSFTFKGVGTSSQKAYTDAFKKLKSTDENLVNFIEKGRQKIVDVYEEQCDETFRKSNLYASQSQYTEAIALLSSVPVFTKSCYKKASNDIKKYYIKDQDQNCEKYLALAETAISLRNYEEAADLLTSIDPSTSCHKKADKLRNRIEKISEQLFKDSQEIAERSEENQMELARAMYASNFRYLSNENISEATLFKILSPLADKNGEVHLASNKNNVLIMGILERPNLINELYIDDHAIDWDENGNFAYQLALESQEVEIEIKVETKDGQNASKFIQIIKSK